MKKQISKIEQEELTACTGWNELEKKAYSAEAELLEYILGREVDSEDIRHYEDCGYLTINTGRDNELYVWYLDGDEHEACIRISDGTIIEDKDATAELFGCN